MTEETNKQKTQFNFGQNWLNYSRNAITAERIALTKSDFKKLMENVPGGLSGKSFLDIGFGQGFSLLSAAALEAKVVGNDINPICGDVIERNKTYFPETAGMNTPLVVGSILEPSIVEELRSSSSQGEGYDVVHSWGVLHHTGNMNLAIANAASLVKPNGYFILAIYNRHWSSFLWLIIKWLYCKSPVFIQKFLIAIFYPIIYAAKWLVTRDDPKKQSRGMDFYYNVIDWVGGYPYEYASLSEMRSYVEPLGFKLVKEIPAEVPTGCNEFVFLRV